MRWKVKTVYLIISCWFSINAQEFVAEKYKNVFALCRGTVVSLGRDVAEGYGHTSLVFACGFVHFDLVGFVSTAICKGKDLFTPGKNSFSTHGTKGLLSHDFCALVEASKTPPLVFWQDEAGTCSFFENELPGGSAVVSGEMKWTFCLAGHDGT